jgi:hypothetical protein
LAVPVLQLPPAQQPPWHACEGPQLEEQARAVVSQACSAPQSPLPLQPQMPPPVTARHRWPALEPPH